MQFCSELQSQYHIPTIFPSLLPSPLPLFSSFLFLPPSYSPPHFPLRLPLSPPSLLSPPPYPLSLSLHFSPIPSLFSICPVHYKEKFYIQPMPLVQGSHSLNLYSPVSYTLLGAVEVSDTTVIAVCGGMGVSGLPPNIGKQEVWVKSIAIELE